MLSSFTKLLNTNVYPLLYEKENASTSSRTMSKITPIATINSPADMPSKNKNKFSVPEIKTPSQMKSEIAMRKIPIRIPIVSILAIILSLF